MRSGLFPSERSKVIVGDSMKAFNVLGWKAAKQAPDIAHSRWNRLCMPLENKGSQVIAPHERMRDRSIRRNDESVQRNRHPKLEGELMV